MSLRCEGCPVQTNGELAACLPSHGEISSLPLDEARFVLGCTVDRLRPGVVETHSVWDGVFAEQTDYTELQLEVERQGHLTQEDLRQHTQDRLLAAFLAELPNFIREGMSSQPYSYQRPYRDIAHHKNPDIAAGLVHFDATSQGAEQWKAYGRALQYITPPDDAGLGLMSVYYHKRGLTVASRMGKDTLIRPISTMVIGEKFLDDGGSEQLAYVPLTPNRNVTIKRSKAVLDEYRTNPQAIAEFASNNHCNGSNGFGLIRMNFTAEAMKKPCRVPSDYIDPQTARRSYAAEHDIFELSQVGPINGADNFRSAATLETVTTITHDELIAFDVPNVVKALFATFGAPESAVQHWTAPYAAARDIVAHADYTSGQPDASAQSALRTLGAFNPYWESVKS